MTTPPTNRVRDKAPAWTADEDAVLRSCIGAELSGAQASKRLGKSRAACIGRAHRLGLRYVSRRRPLRLPRCPHCGASVRQSSAPGQIVRVAERYDTVSTGLGQPTGGPA